MRIGIVDLDTSHPQNWIPIERGLGHEVAGVFDGGSVHPAAYVKDFAVKYAIPRVYDSLEEMATEVDCAIIHGCDWDTHVDKARPFVAARKSVLVDKPLAGNLNDVRQLLQWASAGARITGGSSLRFCAETRDWLAQSLAQRGQPRTVLCGCAVDEFNYGIHAYAMLAGLMGTGAVSVRHLGGGAQRRVQIVWPDGRMGLVVTGAAAEWLPFYATIVTERTIAQFQVDSGKLYRALLEAVLPYLAGETDKPPAPMPELVEPELWALAARKSWLNGDREVLLSELTEADGGYDAKAFANEYRKSKYP
ncbi:MAG: Gfo/Idh/MocA family oxidoreductase [Planctomycetota bacterium]|nr:Gfo/Idh/MocA family oxidoreductase [Planctomycetota bacterium]